MSDETPGPAELSRLVASIRDDQRNGFSAINSRLDKLVSAELYSAEQRRVDERMKDLADDIAKEQQMRAADIATEREARRIAISDQQKTLDKLSANLRWVAAAIILPISLFVANLVIGT